MTKIDHDGIIFYCPDELDGHVKISDVLQNFGTVMIHYKMPKKEDLRLQEQVVISGLKSENYNFQINITNGSFNFIRNEISVSLPLPDDASKDYFYWAIWGPEEIEVNIFESGYSSSPSDQRPPEERSIKRTKTPFTTVPDSLVTWARDLNMLPLTKLSTPGEFHIEFMNALDQIQNKIDSIGAHKLCWDYNGEKDKPPTPKAEPHVTVLIELLLKDVAAQKGFQIIPQAGAAGGSLDFQINKAVVGGKISVLAMEVKNAHATDIEHGLITQLPVYMRSISAEFGIYLVLWYKGKHFKRPKDESFPELHLSLTQSKPRPEKNIRILNLNLAIPEPPSKR